MKVDSIKPRVVPLVFPIVHGVIVWVLGRRKKIVLRCGPPVFRDSCSFGEQLLAQLDFLAQEQAHCKCVGVECLFTGDSPLGLNTQDKGERLTAAEGRLFVTLQLLEKSLALIPQQSL